MENVAQNRGKQPTRRGKRTMNDEENVAQITVDEEEEMVDTVHQGNSDAAPPKTPRSAFIVVFTLEEEEILKREVSRLHSYSIVCRIIGLRPNRGDLRDLLQAAFQHRIGKIVDVQFLGHAFYHLELDTAESVVVMLNANMINIRNAIACFMPWKPGFDPVEMLNSGHRLTLISVVFPRIPKEYMAVSHQLQQESARFFLLERRQ